MKVSIVYKPGMEGQNRLECINGISVPTIDGGFIMIYPKYKRAQLLPDEVDADVWKAQPEQECDALFNTSDGKNETDHLLGLGSPAAKFVRSQGDFNIPTLRQLIAVTHYRKAIDSLAETIEGADVLGGSFVWSSSRCSANLAWNSSGTYGYANYNSMCYSVLAVPCVLLSK